LVYAKEWNFVLAGGKQVAAKSRGAAESEKIGVNFPKALHKWSANDFVHRSTLPLKYPLFQ